jgi:hypothetical protein
VDSMTRGNNFYFAAYFSGPLYLKCREKSSDSISRDVGLVLRLFLLGDNCRRVSITGIQPKRITVFGRLDKLTFNRPRKTGMVSLISQLLGVFFFRFYLFSSRVALLGYQYPP